MTSLSFLSLEEKSHVLSPFQIPIELICDTKATLAHTLTLFKQMDKWMHIVTLYSYTGYFQTVFFNL